MENSLGLLAILCVIALSKRTGLAVVIVVFYIMVMALDDLTPVIYETGSYLTEYYISAIVINILIIAMCVATVRMGFSLIQSTRLYACYIVLFHFLPNLLMVVYGLYSIDLIPNAYYLIMNCAIFVDIIFAVIGTDNKLSRQITFK